MRDPQRVVHIYELGCVGHCIIGHRCRWRRHTQIDHKYRVSTIGLYYQDELAEKPSSLGGSDDDLFETMVFETTANPVPDNDGCGCHDVVSWEEIEGRRYATVYDARMGHEAMVTKYAKLYHQ